jgi:DNA repair exonuclease SbcCD ATPase subunit
MGDEKEWYTNKELFEQLNQFRTDFQDLRSEMKETRSMIKKYNGLREQINNVKGKVEALQANAEGRSSFKDDFLKWGGWLFGGLSVIAAFAKVFLS